MRTREVERGRVARLRPPEVRQEMVARQREMGAEGGVVLDGRDIGTAVFPDADVKFYVDADPAAAGPAPAGGAGRGGQRRRASTRSRRRSASATTPTRTAPDSPLTRAADAIPLDTTALGPEEVVERMLAAVRAREGRPADLARLAAAHLRSGRSWLEVLRTARLSCGSTGCAAARRTSSVPTTTRRSTS